MMSIQEFEVFLRYAEIFVDKETRGNTLKEMGDFLKRIQEANGGAKKLASANKIMKEAEAAQEKARKALEDLRVKEAETNTRLGEAQRELLEKESGLNEQLLKAAARESEADKALTRARRNISAANNVKESAEKLRSEFEEKMKTFSATAKALA